MDEILIEKDLFKILECSQDNSTLFAKIRNTLEELLYIAGMADNAGLLSFYQQADLLSYQELIEGLNSNYDKYYKIFERGKL